MRSDNLFAPRPHAPQSPNAAVCPFLHTRPKLKSFGLQLPSGFVGSVVDGGSVGAPGWQGSAPYFTPPLVAHPTAARLTHLPPLHMAQPGGQNLRSENFFAPLPQAPQSPSAAVCPFLHTSPELKSFGLHEVGFDFVGPAVLPGPFVGLGVRGDCDPGPPVGS